MTTLPVLEIFFTKHIVASDGVLKYQFTKFLNINFFAYTTHIVSILKLRKNL